MVKKLIDYEAEVGLILVSHPIKNSNNPPVNIVFLNDLRPHLLFITIRTGQHLTIRFKKKSNMSKSTSTILLLGD